MSSNQNQTASATTDMPPETIHSTHRWETTDSLLLAIVDAVADATGQDPETMTPLYSAINPDALHRLVASAENEVRITFSYEECTVTVTGNEVVIQTEL